MSEYWCLNIDARSHACHLFIIEMLLSHSGDVTGKVQPIFNKTCKLGKWFLLHFLSEVPNVDDQKQPPTGVPRKRCSEIMQQIYRRAPMPKRDFNKVALQLYWNHALAWLFSCKFAAYFRTLYAENTSGWLVLDGLLSSFWANQCRLHRQYFWSAISGFHLCIHWRYCGNLSSYLENIWLMG